MNVLIIDSNISKANILMDMVYSLDFVNEISFYSFGSDAICELIKNDSKYDYVIIDAELNWQSKNSKYSCLDFLKFIQNQNIDVPVIVNSYYKKLPIGLYDYSNVVAFVVMNDIEEEMEKEETIAILEEVLQRNYKQDLLEVV